MQLRLPMGLLRTASRWYPGLLFHGADAALDANRVALTFDDGPHAQYTPRILDVLQRAEVPATFFFQGSHARQQPDLVRRAHAEGHQVAGHGIDHVSALKYAGAQVLADAEACHELLSTIVGEPLTRCFRPPYGDMTLAGLLKLRQRAFRLAYWTYDSNDSFVKGAQQIVSRLREAPPSAGAVLLFHDDYAQTVEALPAVIDELRGRGLSFATVDELHRV
jgi:peptidoglycan/xylan/chitin deacetylase (PgdA/CDA1 family)